jgi:hypothetical protein|tara:strand:- start:321 stop:560 length:240 start_codon:yes stop_codon:yes gene_type:complete
MPKQEFYDNLRGTLVVGNPQDDSKHWTVKFDDLTFTEILFATGDMSKWMIMDKDQAIGSYPWSLRTVKSSSMSSTPYTA